MTLGYVAARDPELRTAIYDAAVTWGMTPSPFDCWLASAGFTFDLRFEKAQASAAALADALAGRDGISRSSTAAPTIRTTNGPGRCSAGNSATC